MQLADARHGPRLHALPQELAMVIVGTLWPSAAVETAEDASSAR